jgi:hypothetical protein
VPDELLERGVRHDAKSKSPSQNSADRLPRTLRPPRSLSGRPDNRSALSSWVHNPIVTSELGPRAPETRQQTREGRLTTCATRVDDKRATRPSANKRPVATWQLRRLIGRDAVDWMSDLEACYLTHFFYIYVLFDAFPSHPNKMRSSKTSAPPSSPHGLIIGWAVNHALDPIAARAGLEAARVTIPSDRIDKHTAIIAQSGSGKSFFLGRHIEEIVLRTRARCVVLDPNGDFIRVGEIESSTPWGKVEYDFERRQGRLTHESTRAQFSNEWDKIPKRVRAAPVIAAVVGAEPLVVHWTDVSGGLIAPDYDKSRLHEVTDCHRIVQALCQLFTSAKEIPSDQNLLTKAEDLLLSGGSSDISVRLKAQFDVDLIAAFQVERHLRAHGRKGVPGHIRSYLEETISKELEAAFSSICQLDRHIERESKKYYFSKAASVSHDTIFSTTLRKPEHQDDCSLDVIDLSSVRDESTRLLTINAILRYEWEGAVNRWRDAISPLGPATDTRVPTFIVIDEAHHFIPNEPRDSAGKFVREQLRAIAAEGRKYGVFLIVVSQRPDKLDHLVLSECENKVLMRIGSESVLAKARDLLGLEDVPAKILDRAIEFPAGRGLLAGHWIDDTHKFFYSQARRTREGGRGLDSKFWSVKPDMASTPRAKATPAKRRSGKKRRR